MTAGEGRYGARQAYKDKSKPTDIRFSNINAAKGLFYLFFYDS